MYIKFENCWKKLELKLIIKTPIKTLNIINKNCLKAGDEKLKKSSDSENVLE